MAPDDCDCVDYYRERVAELTDWIEGRLRATAERDGKLFALLRSKIASRAARDDEHRTHVAAARDGLARTHGRLKADAEIARRKMADIRRRLYEYVRESSADVSEDDDRPETEALAAENAGLERKVRLCRDQLGERLAALNDAKARLRRDEYVVQRLKYEAIAAIQRRERLGGDADTKRFSGRRSDF